MIKTLNQWCDIPTPMGIFRMYDSGDESTRIISYGNIFESLQKPLLRIHSSCIASEVFGANDCDCADQLREAMKLIAFEQGGIIVHLHQEGRGQGLARKIQAIQLMQSDSLDTFEAFEKLGYQQDSRTYQPVYELLKQLQISSVRLITNNPRKTKFLQGNGIDVDIVHTHPNVRAENKMYLYTKNAKLGHSLPLDDIDNGPIKFYHSDQPWGVLSNFSRHSLFLKNKIWPTVEHFYQAQKFSGTGLEETIRLAETPTLAKEIATEASKQSIRSDWFNVRREIMLDGLRAKFSQHPDLTLRLANSNGRKLVEHTANDDFWGDGGDGSGVNMLGELLMFVRVELSDSTITAKKVG